MTQAQAKQLAQAQEIAERDDLAVIGRGWTHHTSSRLGVHMLAAFVAERIALPHWKLWNPSLL